MASPAPSLPPVRSPLPQQWREFRIEVLPIIVFAATLVGIVLLWRSYVRPLSIVGEVETVKARVISPTDGVLTDLITDRFETVARDQPLGRIQPLDPAAKPIVLRSPINGIVSMLYKRPGEHVVRGDLIAVVSAATSTRIIGYLRQPINAVPSTNDAVTVRTRTQKRLSGHGQILKVGAQLEPINPLLLSPEGKLTEVGLPMLISIPPGMQLFPGEFVDLSIQYAKK